MYESVTKPGVGHGKEELFGMKKGQGERKNKRRFALKKKKVLRDRN